jgi:hypothetical protein
LSAQFPGIDISDVLDLFLVKAEMVNAEPLTRQVCGGTGMGAPPRL